MWPREKVVVHLHGLNLSGQLVGGEGDNHAGFDDTNLDTAHWDCSNTSNFVDILRRRVLNLVRIKFWMKLLRFISKVDL